MSSRRLKARISRLAPALAATPPFLTAWPPDMPAGAQGRGACPADCPILCIGGLARPTRSVSRAQSPLATARPARSSSHALPLALDPAWLPSTTIHLARCRVSCCNSNYLPWAECSRYNREPTQERSDSPLNFQVAVRHASWQADIRAYSVLKG